MKETALSKQPKAEFLLHFANKKCSLIFYGTFNLYIKNQLSLRFLYVIFIALIVRRLHNPHPLFTKKTWMVGRRLLILTPKKYPKQYVSDIGFCKKESVS